MNINSKEVDTNQHYIYIPVMNINYRYMSTCIIGGIKNTILPQRKWMLTNEVNKNDQTFKLSTINPQEHTNITQQILDPFHQREREFVVQLFIS